MNKLQQFIAGLQGGYLKAAQMPELIALDRLFPVLVRCGNGRFTTAAQDAGHFMACVKAGGDYVRDVSLPVGSMERAEKWQPECPVTPVTMLPQSFTAPRQARKNERGTVNAGRAYSQWFNENDCGGAFDGNSVSSDADSGL